MYFTVTIIPLNFRKFKILWHEHQGHDKKQLDKKKKTTIIIVLN